MTPTEIALTQQGGRAGYFEAEPRFPIKCDLGGYYQGWVTMRTPVTKTWFRLHISKIKMDAVGWFTLSNLTAEERKHFKLKTEKERTNEQPTIHPTP